MPLNIQTRRKADTATASILIYGPPASGKTQTASQVPGSLILDCEGGARGVTGVIAEIKQATDMAEAITHLRRAKGEYQAVVLDGLDWLHTMAVEAAREGKISIGPQRANKNPTSWHAVATDWTAHIVHELHELPLLLVVTAHSREYTETTNEGELVSVHFDLPRRIREQIAATFDVVLYAACPPGKDRSVYIAKHSTKRDTVQRENRQVQRERTFFAKDRYLRFNGATPLTWQSISDKLGLGQPPQPPAAEQSDLAEYFEEQGKQ
jgi:hypothetical protein